MYRVFIVLGLVAMLLSPPMWPSSSDFVAPVEAAMPLATDPSLEPAAMVEHAQARTGSSDLPADDLSAGTLLVPEKTRSGKQASISPEQSVFVNSVLVYSGDKPTFEFARTEAGREIERDTGLVTLAGPWKIR